MVHVLDKPHNPLLNSGAIMSSALLLKLVQPEMEMSEKFDLVWQYFSKIAGMVVAKLPMLTIINLLSKGCSNVNTILLTL